MEQNNLVKTIGFVVREILVKEAAEWKQAVEQYKEEHGDLPPGINWREEVVVNVRRS